MHRAQARSTKCQPGYTHQAAGAHQVPAKHELALVVAARVPAEHAAAAEIAQRLQWLRAHLCRRLVGGGDLAAAPKTVTLALADFQTIAGKCARLLPYEPSTTLMPLTVFMRCVLAAWGAELVVGTIPAAQQVLHVR